MEYWYQIISGQKQGAAAVCCRFFLYVLSWFYTGIVAIRNLFFDYRLRKIRRLPIPVISVGNLTLGGTGKTPFAAYLVRYFLEHGHRPGIISRGYAKGSSGTNDEYLELAFRFPDTPHIQNKNRCAAAEEFLLRKNADILILDDAFQHRHLDRTLNIVLLDATVPLGSNYLFPRGTLREPVSGLQRADIVLLSRADLIGGTERERIRKYVEQIAPNTLWGEIAYIPAMLVSVTKTVGTLESLHNQKVLAFCGIGNPAAFRSVLERCGVTVAAFIVFSDHRRYSSADLDRLENAAKACHPDAVLCTMKDIVKINKPMLADIPIQAVAVETQWLKGQDEVTAALDKMMEYLC